MFCCVLSLWIFLSSKVYFILIGLFGSRFITLITGKGSNYVLSFILMSVQWTSFESTIPIPKLAHCICTTRMKLSFNNSFVIKSNTCFIPTEMRIKFCAYIKSCKSLFCSSWLWKCLGNCCSLGTCCCLPISWFTDKSFLLVPGNDVLILPHGCDSASNSRLSQEKALATETIPRNLNI